MPPIRSLTSERWAKLISTIILLGKIMPSYSRYVKRRLLYIIIIALSSRQSSSYIKCTKLNICLSCNIRLVSNAEYIFLVYLVNL